LLDEGEDAAIDNALGHHGQQLGVRDAVEVFRQVGVYDFGVAGPKRVGDVVDGVVCRFLGPESVRVVAEIRFKNRFDDELHRHLRYPVANRRYPQRPHAAVRFGDQHAPHRLGSVGLRLQITGQFPQESFYPFAALDGFEVDPVNAGTASVGPDQTPGVTEDVFPVGLVVERVETVGRFLLGLGIELPLERPDRVRGG